MTGAFIKIEEGRIDLALGTRSNHVEISIFVGGVKAILFLNQEEMGQLKDLCGLFEDTLSDRKFNKEIEDLNLDADED